MRRAVVLAAGRGSRLRPAWDHPKCLLPVGGRPLLQRYIRALARAGLREMIVVTGYRQAEVQDLVNRRAADCLRVRLVPNARYARGSVCSLEAARPWMTGPVLLMDGDVFFEDALLARLLRRTAEGLAIDPTAPYSAEAYIGALQGGRVVAMARGLRARPAGEWVGLTLLDGERTRRLRTLAHDRVVQGDLGAAYEDLVGDTIAERAIPAVTVADLRWREIDTPADLAAAERLAAGRPDRVHAAASARTTAASAGDRARALREDGQR